MDRKRSVLLLGGGEAGWHLEQLRQCCLSRDLRLASAAYESLSAQVTSAQVTSARATANATRVHCSQGPLSEFDVVFARTMPLGSLERITFRLAMLHHLVRTRKQTMEGPVIVNSPASLELSIDKFATLAIVASLGYPVPDTFVVQTRSEAIDAFDRLGGDCVVKPLFGGEGRGVMRIEQRELARTAFATLDQLQATIYLQRFVPPGGRDVRLLKIGDELIAMRRINDDDFRTNVSTGGSVQRIEPEPQHQAMCTRVFDAIGLTIGTVDLIDDPQTREGYRVIEVNAIPGWKGAQAVCDFSIADRIVDVLCQQMNQSGQSVSTQSISEGMQ